MVKLPLVHPWAVSPYNAQRGLLLDPFAECEITPHTAAQVAEIAAHCNDTVENTLAILLDEYAWPVFRNDLYQVQLRWEPETMKLRRIGPGRMQAMPDLVHVSIKLIDKSPIHDWRHLQEIKNRLIGPEFEAVELYPAEARTVDTANQYHLWAFGDPAALRSIGFNQGRNVSYADGVGGARQRGKDAPRAAAINRSTT